MPTIQDADNKDGKIMAEDKDGRRTTGDKMTDAGVYGSTAEKLSLVGKKADFKN